jgi:antitoxin MazE
MSLWYIRRINSKVAKNMIIRAAKWGHSLAIRVTKAEAKALRIEPETPLKKSIIDGNFVIEPVVGAIPFYTLDELLVGMTPENRHAEVDTGYAVGKEVW